MYATRKKGLKVLKKMHEGNIHVTILSYGSNNAVFRDYFDTGNLTFTSITFFGYNT